MSICDPDREVLDASLTWLRDGHRVVLFTVARTWGSSPRPLGSLLVVRHDGRLVGSVSGGCVEEDLVERCQAGEWLDAGVRGVAYGVDRAEADRFGLPCGGRLELVAETLVDGSSLEPVTAALDARRLTAREVDLRTGMVRLQDAAHEDLFHYDPDLLRKVFGPKWRLVIIGAGQLSRYVAEFARPLGYEVIVCDPRAEYTQGFDVEGVRLESDMPDDVVRALATDTRSAVLALTHDPRLDDMALMEALESPAFYVGAIGSMGNQGKRSRRLIELGVAKARLGALHGPVGLPIGSKTPAEIAVAVVAELVASRNGVRLQRCEPSVDAGVDARWAVALSARGV